MASQIKLMSVSINSRTRSKAIDIVKKEVIKKSPETDFTQYVSPKPTRADVSQYFSERNLAIPEHRSCAIDRYFKSLEDESRTPNPEQKRETPEFGEITNPEQKIESPIPQIISLPRSIYFTPRR